MKQSRMCCLVQANILEPTAGVEHLAVASTTAGCCSSLEAAIHPCDVQVVGITTLDKDIAGDGRAGCSQASAGQSVQSSE